MSDEEKKAIERLKDLISKSKVIGNIEINKQVAFKDIETILNIIEKQSKEIEELKEKNKEQYKEFIKEHGEVCEKLKEDINKEWEDKIKAILEEYKYTEIGDSKKIIEFYKKIQSLLEKE